MASIQKRQGKRGTTWTARVDAGEDPGTGKRLQKRVSAKTKRELLAKITEIEHAVNRGAYVDASRMTLGEFLVNEWLPTVRPPAVKPGTFVIYEKNVRLHLAPGLGAVRLSKLTASQVQAFYNAKIDAGLAPSTVRVMHTQLSQALKYAERSGKVARNVCKLVNAPKPTTTERRTWTAAQAARFLEATAGGELAMLWHLAIVTGMRRGEMLGLRWGDIDWRRGQIAVRRNLSRIGNEWIFGTTKTGKDRTVSIPPATLEALEAHQGEQQRIWELTGAVWSEDELVFVHADGEPYDGRNVLDIFKRATRRAGVPVIRFHDLRHTAATLMMAGGVHPRIVQQQLGHSTVSLTLDIYSHVSDTMQHDAALHMEKTLRLGIGCDTFVTNTPSVTENAAPALGEDE